VLKIGRRRQANVKGGRQFSHRVTVSEDQELVLRELAETAQVSVPRLMIDAVLSPQSGGMSRDEKIVVLSELARLSRLMANVANNVNQIAKRLHGTGEFDEAVLESWRAYCVGHAMSLDDIEERLMEVWL
jgi:hypothetical protein